MSAQPRLVIEPTLDLVLERIVDVPKDLLWRAWTVPEHLKQWYTPAPWQTVDCEIDLRPGGIFRTVMRSPEGQEFSRVCCYLEVIEHERLIWTDALAPGYRPVTVASSVPSFTAVVQLESLGRRTKYTAIAMHKDSAGRTTHEAMGFHEGWGKGLEQLVAFTKTLQ